MTRLMHGKAKEPIYNIWNAMRSRCENPKVKAFSNYGGRGISVCERWKKFENFLADMGERPAGMSLDRVNNDLGYSPDNCRWTDRRTQARNKRGLRLATVKGQSKSIGEWAEIYGISVSTICARLKNGWDEERAVTVKVITRRKGLPRGTMLREYGEVAA